MQFPITQGGSFSWHWFPNGWPCFWQTPFSRILVDIERIPGGLRKIMGKIIGLVKIMGFHGRYRILQDLFGPGPQFLWFPGNFLISGPSDPTADELCIRKPSLWPQYIWYLYNSIYIYTYVYVYASVYACMCMYVYIYIYIYVYVCVVLYV